MTEEEQIAYAMQMSMSFTKLWVGKYNHERIGPIGLSLLIAILFLVFLLLLLQKKDDTANKHSDFGS